MTDLAQMFLIPAVSIWGIFILLTVYAHKRGLPFTRQEKRSSIIILIILAGVSGWFFFFEDTGFVFICQKSTGRCDYYHSTFYNRQLRFVRSYDLTGITETEIVPHKRTCGKHCRKTVYRIRFQGKGDCFEMPKDLDFKEDAERQASKAAAFIQTDKPRYQYKDIMPDNAGNELMLIMGAVFSMAFAFGGILTVLVKLFKKE